MKLSPTQTPEVASQTHQAAAVEGIRMQASAAVMETVQAMPPTAPSGATADQRLAMPMEGMVLQLILMLANVMSKLTVPSGLLTAQNLVFVKKLLSLVQMDLLDEV